MDLGTIIITLIFISFIVLPFVLTGVSRNRKKRKMLQKISEMALGNNNIISEYEFCSDFITGLDLMANQLFFYKKNDNRELTQHLNLQDFKSCKVVSYGHGINDKKDYNSVIDRLELCFYPLSKEKGTVSLDIYNSEFDRLTLIGELKFAEKWEKKICDRLKWMSESKSAGGSSIKMNSAEANKKAIHKPKKAS